MSLTIEKNEEIIKTTKNSFLYYSRYLITLLLLFAFFSIMSNSIIDIKLLELKFYVNKEQLLNYELSSKILREKIKNILISKDDYVAELKNNILESAVMNSQISSEELSISLSERVGLVVVNIVRLISLNERLSFIEDRNIMYQIQYAFFMERTKKFSAAIKKYEEITIKLKNSNSYENGFVLLHLGYCYAMTGSTNNALQILYKTEEIFTGSQFGDYARILINVIIENDKRSKEIDRLPISLSEKANLYYENGRYSETVSALDKIENRNSEQNFVRARSLEELGNVNAAAGEYVKIVEKKDSTSVAIKANRRIMIIGSIYENNVELKEYSKQNAQTLGDSEFIKTVESGSTLIKSNVVIEKISSSGENSRDIDKDEAVQIAELKSEFNTFTIERKKEISETASLVSKIIQEKKYVKPPNLIVVLIDGRILFGDWIEISSGLLILNSSQFPISLPIANIFEISMEPSKSNKDFSIRIEDGSKFYSGVSKISINSFKWTAFRESESISLKETSNYEIKIEESKKEE